MISVKVLRAAGLTDAQIIAVLEAELRDTEERTLANRERERIKKRNQRAQQNVPRDTGDTGDTGDIGGVVPAPPAKTRLELEKELFDRGKAVLGQGAGGLIVNLLRSKAGDLALARAAIETASTKQSPREYIGGVIKGGTNGFQRPRPGQEPNPHSQEGRRQRTSEAIGKLRAVARGGGPDDRPTFDGLWPDDKGPSGS